MTLAMGTRTELTFEASVDDDNTFDASDTVYNNNNNNNMLAYKPKAPVCQKTSEAQRCMMILDLVTTS